MLARTAHAVKVTRKHLCRDFGARYQACRRRIFFNKWWDVGKATNQHQKSYQLPHQQPHARNARMFRFLISLYQAANLHQQGRRAYTVGATHHDGELCSLACRDDIKEVFLVILTDDIVGLFVKVTIAVSAVQQNVPTSVDVKP